MGVVGGSGGGEMGSGWSGAGLNELPFCTPRNRPRGRGQGWRHRRHAMAMRWVLALPIGSVAERAIVRNNRWLWYRDCRQSGVAPLSAERQLGRAAGGRERCVSCLGECARHGMTVLGKSIDPTTFDSAVPVRLLVGQAAWVLVPGRVPLRHQGIGSPPRHPRLAGSTPSSTALAPPGHLSGRLHGG